LEGAAENIAKRAAQLAEEGNVAAIRICMNRLSRTLTTASFTFRGGAEHACCRPCYVPVRRAGGFAFCQPVQIDDEGSPVNFTFYREPVPLLLFAARSTVPALKFTGLQW